MLPEYQKQSVTVCEKIPDGDLYRYGTGSAVRAIIQPVTSRTLTEVYGERVTGMLQMYCEWRDAVSEGMGVCVYVDMDAPCDYRVVAVDAWPGHHRECLLERIDEGRRGARGGN